MTEEVTLWVSDDETGKGMNRFEFIFDTIFYSSVTTNGCIITNNYSRFLSYVAGGLHVQCFSNLVRR